MLYRRPDLLHRILDVNARAVIAYLNAQIEAGAQAVMIFDTWGGALARRYREFSLAYCSRCSTASRANATGCACRISFHEGRRRHGSRAIAAIGCDAVGSTGRSISAARARASAPAPPCKAISIRRCCCRSRDRREGGRACSRYGRGSGHMFNLGHGVSRFTPPENVGILVEAVHELSRPYH